MARTFVNTQRLFFDTRRRLLSPAQVKMARAALGLGVRDLAELAECAPSTVLRFETGKGGMQTGTLARIRTALEAEGIVFIEADDKFGAGVRLRARR